MRQKSWPEKQPAEDAIRDIFGAQPVDTFQLKRRSARTGRVARGEKASPNSVGARASPRRYYYGWSLKEFLEARWKRRLAGDTARAATSDEVKDLRRGSTSVGRRSWPISHSKTDCSKKA